MKKKKRRDCTCGERERERRERRKFPTYPEQMACVAVPPTGNCVSFVSLSNTQAHKRGPASRFNADAVAAFIVLITVVVLVLLSGGCVVLYNVVHLREGPLAYFPSLSGA